MLAFILSLFGVVPIRASPECGVQEGLSFKSKGSGSWLDSSGQYRKYVSGKPAPAPRMQESRKTGRHCWPPSSCGVIAWDEEQQIGGEGPVQNKDLELWDCSTR